MQFMYSPDWSRGQSIVGVWILLLVVKRGDSTSMQLYLLFLHGNFTVMMAQYLCDRDNE